MLSIQLVPLLAEAVGWQYTFLLLVPGPLLGALGMRALKDPASHRTTKETLCHEPDVPGPPQPMIDVGANRP